MARIANHTSEETKKQIKDAFLALYENYPIEKISIRLLSEEAGMNRGTFYYYYADIYALLEEIEDDMIKKWSHILPQMITAFLLGESQKMTGFVEDFYQENYRYVRLFLAVKPNQRLVNYAQNCARKAVLAFFGKSEEELSMEEQCMLTYTTYAQFGTICWWLLHTEEMSLEEMMRLLQKLSTNGPFTVLKESLGIQQTVQ